MQDGLVDRYFNRRLSSHLTRWFLRTSLAPNQITLISFMVGLISGCFFWKGGYLYSIIGALVFQCSAVLDCCDGEVARLKSMQSRLGQWLDVGCDNIVHVVLLMAIAWSIYRASDTPSYLILGFLSSMGSLLSLWLVLLSHPQPFRRPQDLFTGRGNAVLSESWPAGNGLGREGIRGAAGPHEPSQTHDRDGLLRKATDRLTNRDFSVILLLFTLVGRLDWFLWLAALGTNIFWLVLLWLYRKEVRSF